MAKGPSPLLGYNTNVRHKGKLYHIQTEDSGLRYPHIITHLFADGGRIVATRKTSYAEHVNAEDVRITVKKLMQEQHKAMFIALRDGVYDEDETPGGDGQPASRDTGAAKPKQVAPSGPIAAETPTKKKSAPPAPLPLTNNRSPRPTPVNIDALERAAARLAAAAPEATKRPASERPPPIASSASGRYQTTQPARRETSARPAPSIFGGDLLSEKSLDEVILSYLAEDLDDDGL